VRWVTCFPDGDPTPRVCTLLHVQHITCCHGGQVAGGLTEPKLHTSQGETIRLRGRCVNELQSESAAFRRISLISSSGDCWCGLRCHGYIRRDSAMFDIIRCSAMFADIRRTYPMFSDVRRYSAILSELQFTIVTPVTVLRRPANRPDAQLLAGITRGHAWV